MAITSKIANSFLYQLVSGNTHMSSHTYKMALYDSGATMNALTTAYTTSNEIAAAGGYTAGGATASSYAVTISNSVTVLTFSDVAWASSTFSARGCLIYNDTMAGDPAVACFDFGSTITGGGGTFTVVMPTANSTSGLIRISNA